MSTKKVFLNDDLLITTIDYHAWTLADGKNNDEWYNKDQYKDIIIRGRVTKISINKSNALFVELDNSVRIECCVANAYPHYEKEQEQWLLFEHTKDHSGRFPGAYNKSLSFEY